MLNCVDEPSSLGAAIPSVSKYAAVGPVAPVLPQFPQVSHGDSSTRSSTVLLGAVTGVGVGEGEAAGVGEGDAAGVGVGTTPATVVVPVVPHETSAKVTA